MSVENSDLATVAGGCFWCLEAPIRQLRGVRDVVSGYMGGRVADPDYKQVCSGTTGHAEVIRIHFDPEEIAYEDLLKVFFSLHDPTTPNRQGNDVGTQYRSAVFYHDDQQRQIALECIDAMNKSGEWAEQIVTEVQPATTFYPAEEYHQHYFERNPTQPYCMAVITPKLEKMRKLFEGKLK